MRIRWKCLGTHHGLTASWLMWALIAIAQACTVDVPGGVYACEADADCPDGQVCRGQLCERAGGSVYNGPRGDGEACASNEECASSACKDAVCAAPSCDDAVKNGDELGTDCGGACPACSEGEACERATDCASGVCLNNVCLAASCTDKLQNGDESDKDCGGSQCDPCEVGATCTQHEDCVSKLCGDGKCSTPACTDGAQNGSETDKDCGGSDCPKCVAGLACKTAGDCESALCADGICTQATCKDGLKNGSEVDVDCGGSDCDKCADGATCDKGDDCTSGVCANDACAAPSCTDGLKNGNELDKDCGGDNYCPRCVDGTICQRGQDCVSGYCDAASSQCKTPTCDDGVQNQDEEGVDCGGDTCMCCLGSSIKNEPADDDRGKAVLGVSSKRNYATSQGLISSKALTMQRFNMYFVRGVTNASGAARAGKLTLLLRDAAGKVLKTASADVAQNFAGGYVYWDKLNFAMRASTLYYFTVYVAAAQDEGLSIEYATDTGTGYALGVAYTKYIASTAADSGFNAWSGWSADAKTDRVFVVQTCVQ